MRAKWVLAAVMGVGLAGIGAAECMAVPLTFDSWVVVPTGNPFAGQTPVDSVTSSNFNIYGVDYGGLPGSQYLAATGSVTTEVYRTRIGTLGLAYTINTEGFAPPYQGPPYQVTAIPSFQLSGFIGAANVSVNPALDMTAIRSADGGTIHFNFSSGGVPVFGDPHFYDFYAGMSQTVYVQTDLVLYQNSTATLGMQLFDSRQLTGGTPMSFAIPTFVPSVEGGIIPEPMTLVTLPLALGVMVWRMRRCEHG